MTRNPYPVGIIGAGPAGIAAAIQLERSGISPLVLERDQIGGLLRNANWVENYPGFPAGISGYQLTKLFSDQAHQIGVNITLEEAKRVEYRNHSFFISGRKQNYQVQQLIIASGTRNNRLNEPAIPEYCHRYIFYEVHPLLDRQSCNIVILGAGDAAFDYALNLAKRNRVILINRGSDVKCLDLLFQRAMHNPQIDYHTNTTISNIAPSDSTNLIITCITGQTTWLIDADFFLIAIGRSPQLDFLPRQLTQKMDELSQRGLLYLVGDVANGLYRQTGIAVGDGLRAAMSIVLEKNRE